MQCRACELHLVAISAESYLFMCHPCEEHALIMIVLVIVDHAAASRMLAEGKSAMAHTIRIFKASRIGDHVAIRLKTSQNDKSIACRNFCT